MAKRHRAFHIRPWIARIALRQRNPVVASIVAIALTCLISAGEFASGDELSLAVFYLIPLFIAAFWGGARMGVALAFLTATVWLIVDISVTRGYRFFWSPYANAVAKLMAYLIFVQAIAWLRLLLEREQRLARADPLTGALNRRAFLDHLGNTLGLVRRGAFPVTIALIDIDNFKWLNDNKGHAEGDHLLRDIVDTAREQLRQSDCFARLGGDEFVLLLPGAGQEDALQILAGLHNELNHLARRRGWAVGFSVGAIVIDKRVPSNEDALREADRVMYTAKHLGKNRIHIQYYGRETSLQ